MPSKTKKVVVSKAVPRNRASRSPSSDGGVDATAIFGSDTVITTPRAPLPFDVIKAVDVLSKKDKRLKSLIAKVGPCRLELDHMMTPYEALAESIVYQQLTGKAAATIFSRVKALYGGERLPDPRLVIATPDEKLRGAGLSSAKTAALKDLSEKQVAGLVPSLDQLENMSDEEIIAALTQIRGIGRWTVEMLLMFRLGRPDVWPINDYGVRKGFAAVFGHRELPTPKQLGAFGEPYKPYRSVVAWYMWRALELPEFKKTP